MHGSVRSLPLGANCGYECEAHGKFTFSWGIRYRRVVNI